MMFYSRTLQDFCDPRPIVFRLIHFFKSNQDTPWWKEVSYFEENSLGLTTVDIQAGD